MARLKINSGNPPLIWSDMDAAFQDINSNFLELYLTLEGGSGEVVDLTDLTSNVSPRTTEFYDLGSETKRWKDLWLSGSSIHLGDAVISSTGTTVNLPVGSTIGGLRVDESYFKTIAVSGEDNIEADEGTDTLNISTTGTGLAITTSASTDTITFENTGVVKVNGTAGQISVSNSGVGEITLTNLGVLSVTQGLGISVSGTQAVTIANTGILGIDAGVGITVSARDPVTGSVTISSPASQSVFTFVEVPGQGTIQADSTTDTLIFTTTGDGLEITTNTITDTVTFRNTGVTSLAVDDTMTVSTATGNISLSLNSSIKRDVQGSIFADDSSMLVDGTSGRLIGPWGELENIGGANNLVDQNNGNFLNFNADESNFLRLGTASSNNVVIISDYDGENFEWTFDNTGELTVPGNVNLVVGTLGNIESANGIDLYATESMDWAQLNWNNQNFVYADSDGAHLQAGPTELPGIYDFRINTDGTLQLTNGTLISDQGDSGSTQAVGFGWGGDKFTIDTGSEVNPWVFARANTDLLALTSDTLVRILTGTMGDSNGFEFDENGLRFPDETIQTTAFTGRNDINGSVFADNSTLLVDAVSGILPAENVKGDVSECTFQGTSGDVITAFINDEALADASTDFVPTQYAVKTYVDSAIAGLDVIGNFIIGSSTIDVDDSTGVSIVPATTFNSDVTVENDLFVDNSVFVTGSITAGEFISSSVNVPEIGSATNLNLTAGNAVVITSSPLRLSSFTTGERDILTAQNGDLIYNISLGKTQIYQNSAWVSVGNTDFTTLTATQIDTSDSSALEIIPSVNLNSDVTVGGDVLPAVSGGGNLGSSSNIWQNFYAVNSNISNIVSDVTMSGTVTLTKTTDVIGTKLDATGVVTHDCSSNTVFYHSSIDGNFTANFTNIPTTNDRAINVILILDQGGIAYIPTAVQIASSAQTIKWLGAAGAPSGNANQVDIVSFSLIRTGNSWTVLGSLTTYG